MKIDPRNLELLHKYLLDDGDASTEGFKAFLGTSSENTVKAYQTALTEAHPDIYGEDDEDEVAEASPESEPEPAPEPKAAKPKKAGAVVYGEKPSPCGQDKRILLHDADTGRASELELHRETEKSVIYVLKEPKDEVQILVAGESLTVDLLKLKKLDPSAAFAGHKVSTLILAAELAKV